MADQDRPASSKWGVPVRIMAWILAAPFAIASLYVLTFPVVLILVWRVKGEAETYPWVAYYRQPWEWLSESAPFEDWLTEYGYWVGEVMRATPWEPFG